jgi:DNA-binding NarL/FixJ family response regulator
MNPVRIRLFCSLLISLRVRLLSNSCEQPSRRGVDDLLAGGSPMSSAIARKVVQHFQRDSAQRNAELKQTPREQEILDLLVKGALYKEIAWELGIGVETVRTHLHNIYGKLHVRTRTEAVVKYLGRG